MPRAGIALGSNLGDRLRHLRSAIDHLREVATPGEPFLTAPIYQAEPRLCPPDSPDFLNTVVEIDFAGSPHDLLNHTRAIEKSLPALISKIVCPNDVLSVILIKVPDRECPQKSPICRVSW